MTVGLLRTALAVVVALVPALGAAGVRPVYGGELRVALPAAPRQLDPARATEPSDLAAVSALHATPLVVGAGGKLEPGLLAEVPEPLESGRVFRLRLAPGLRFSDGSPLTAADLAASLARLLARGAPHAALALPILGADAVADGRATALSGVQVVSDAELVVTLAFPLPEFPQALAALPSAVVSPRGLGAGPFVLAGRDTAGIRLAPNALSPRGRPFADALLLSAVEPRGVTRALARGELALVLRPEAIPGATITPLPPLVATYAAVNGRRLGTGADAVRRALASLDRAELARLFVRGTSEPLASLLPAAILPGARAPTPAAPGPAASPPPPRVVLLVLASSAEQRAIAERIQVKLFDRGVRAAVETADPARFAARLEAGDFDVALVPVPLPSLAPAIAAGEVAHAIHGPRAARRALEALAGLALAEARPAADRLAHELDVVPLLASGLRASASAALQGLAVRPDGRLDPGDLWLAPGGAR